MLNTGIQNLPEDSIQTSVQEYLASQSANSPSPLEKEEKRACLYSASPRFCSIPAAYKRRITRKKRERKMEFEMFHNPIGAFRRKADYKNGTKKITVKNEGLLEQLRKIEPGEWKKVYQNGYVNGEEASIHYFQHTKTGKVFNVKVYWEWSTGWN